VPEIFAAGALDLIDGLRATRCFIQNFGGERMREMMLADDDLGINAEIAGRPRISMTRPVAAVPPCG